MELAMQVVGEYGGCYDSHIRGRGANVVEAVEEAIRVGERPASQWWTSHVKVIGAENEGFPKRSSR